jgi:hypothetical protein
MLSRVRSAASLRRVGAARALRSFHLPTMPKPTSFSQSSFMSDFTSFCVRKTDASLSRIRSVPSFRERVLSAWNEFIRALRQRISSSASLLASRFHALGSLKFAHTAVGRLATVLLWSGSAAFSSAACDAPAQADATHAAPPVSVAPAEKPLVIPSLLSRLLSVLIDACAMSLLASVVAYPLSIFLGSSLFALTIPIFMPFVYDLICFKWNHGVSIGKSICGLAVVNTNGQPITLSQVCLPEFRVTIDCNSI